MLSGYEVREKYNFVRVVLVIGSLLIGTGVLSFIAGNWSVLPNAVKFLMILLGVCLFYYAGWISEHSYPKTSKSLYYAGMLIYGAGIFLIGQMFHLDGDYRGAFLLWALGVIPLALYLKDKWLAVFASFLMLVYGYVFDRWDPYPFVLWFSIPLMYVLNETKFHSSRLLLFFMNALTLLFLMANLICFGLEYTWITAVLFITGLSMTFVAHSTYKEIFQWQGAIVMGITGIIMTLDNFWEEFGLQHPEGYGIGFSILFAAMTLYLVKKGILPAIFLVCAIIFRYYVDFSFSFLPKSLFFVVGGLILLGFGYWFERKRREGKPHHDNR